MLYFNFVPFVTKKCILPIVFDSWKPRSSAWAGGYISPDWLCGPPRMEWPACDGCYGALQPSRRSRKSRGIKTIFLTMFYHVVTLFSCQIKKISIGTEICGLALSPITRLVIQT